MQDVIRWALSVLLLAWVGMAQAQEEPTGDAPPPQHTVMAATDTEALQQSLRTERLQLAKLQVITTELRKKLSEAHKQLAQQQSTHPERSQPGQREESRNTLLVIGLPALLFGILIGLQLRQRRHPTS